MCFMDRQPKTKLNLKGVLVCRLPSSLDPETKLSPAMCIFGRLLKDFIPILPGRYQPHPIWQDTLQKREEALRNRHIKATEHLSEHTRRLPPQSGGQSPGTEPDRTSATSLGEDRESCRGETVRSILGTNRWL